jgi:O-antigen/teichoic acid export membrane protein
MRALKGIVTGNLGRFLSLGYTAITIPLLITYLGAEMFGAWSTVRGFSAYLQNMGLGIGYVLVFSIAHSVGANERHKIRELVSSAFFPGTGFALLIGAVLSAVIFVFPITELFGLSTQENSNSIRSVLMILLWAMVTGTIVGILLSVRSGLQQEYKNNVWGMIGTFLAVTGLILGIKLGARVELLAVSIFFIPVFAMGANVTALLNSHPDAIPRLSAIRIASFKRLFSQGTALTGAQIFAAVLWSTDNLVIASALGAAAVVPYAVTFTIIYAAFGAIHSITTSYGAAIRESFASQDWEWLEATHRKIFTIVLNLSGGAAVWLYFWGNDAISIWVGPDIASDVSPNLMTLLAIYLPLVVWNSTWAFPITALGRFRWQLLIIGFEAIANLGLSLWLVRHWGITGVAVGTLLPAAVVSSWAFPWLLSRVTEGHLRPTLGWTQKRLLLPIGLVIAVGVVLNLALPSQSPLVRVLVGGSLTLLASLIFTAIVGFDFNRSKLRLMLRGHYDTPVESDDQQ